MTALRLIAALSLAGLTACSPQPGIDFNSNIQGHMRGSLPIVDQVDQDLSSGYVEQDRGELYLEINTLPQSGWAMLGVMAQVEEDGSISIDNGEVYGCAGGEEYDAEFDEDADEASIEVKTIEIDGQTFEQYEITAVFGDDTMTGVAVVPAEHNK